MIEGEATQARAHGIGRDAHRARQRRGAQRVAHEVRRHVARDEVGEVVDVSQLDGLAMARIRKGPVEQQAVHDSECRLLQAGWARWFLHVWTFLICASVLTTYQHHFIDIPTGALLGLLCVWLWPLEREVALPAAWRLSREPQRLKLASLYFAGGAGLLALGLWWGGVALWLAWPAASLAVVALNYLGFGARGFRMDRSGRMHWSARWLLAPYLWAAAFNAWAWTRRSAKSIRPR